MHVNALVRGNDGIDCLNNLFSVNIPVRKTENNVVRQFVEALLMIRVYFIKVLQSSINELMLINSFFFLEHYSCQHVIVVHARDIKSSRVSKRSHSSTVSSP
jgi:hypothetical protein